MKMRSQGRGPRAGRVGALAGTLLVLAAGAAVAQSAVQAVATRQAGYKALGRDFKLANDQLRSDKPDLPAVRKAAQEMADTGAQIGHWFPKGSGPESGVKTQAKALIWTEPQAFAAAQAAYVAEANKFNKLAQAGDVDEMQSEVKLVGAQCGACHNRYREKT